VPTVTIRQAIGFKFLKAGDWDTVHEVYDNAYGASIGIIRTVTEVNETTVEDGNAEAPTETDLDSYFESKDQQSVKKSHEDDYLEKNKKMPSKTEQRQYALSHWEQFGKKQGRFLRKRVIRSTHTRLEKKKNTRVASKLSFRRAGTAVLFEATVPAVDLNATTAAAANMTQSAFVANLARASEALDASVPIPYASDLFIGSPVTVVPGQNVTTSIEVPVVVLDPLHLLYHNGTGTLLHASSPTPATLQSPYSHGDANSRMGGQKKTNATAEYSVTLMANTTVTNLGAVLTGDNLVADPPLYAIEPALPGGLSINNRTGSIQGTPRDAVPSTSFSVLACNQVSHSWVIFVLTVIDVPPAKLAYSLDGGTFQVGVPMPAPIQPQNRGGSIISYAVTPTLPTGIRSILGILSIYGNN